METKKNEFTGLLKDKKIATKKEAATKVGDNKPKSQSFAEKSIVSMKNLYMRMRKAFMRSNKFLSFLFSVTIFIVCPMYIYYMNTQLYNYIRLNGGLRKEGGPMGGMRPY